MASTFLNRYVTSAGHDYRVCYARNGEGGAGRLMLIVRRGPRGDLGPALDPKGRRGREILEALAEVDRLAAAREAGITLRVV